ncbi:MAG: cytochrome C [Bacteroidetes bacterium]|nr:cytochrome C [Bacteroidota bacterium]
MKENSTVLLFIDYETQPLAEFEAPVNFELDTRKLPDGKHTLRIVSKDPHGKEGLRIVPFEVKNGPAISIDGLHEHAIVDGIIPLMINAYSKGNQKKFMITGSETPKSIPSWMWILLIGFFAWALYYFATYISLNPA